MTRRRALGGGAAGVTGLFALIALLSSGSNEPARAQGLGDISLARSLIGRPAPVVDVAPVSGDAPLTLLTLRGRVVVLAFTSSFCGICRDTATRLDALARSRRERGLAVLSLSRDPFDQLVRLSVEQPRAFTTARDESGATFRRYFARYLPTRVLIDRRGIVREVYVGAGSSIDEQLGRRVDELLAEPAAGD